MIKLTRRREILIGEVGIRERGIREGEKRRIV
jgi:hypothetical protein